MVKNHLKTIATPRTWKLNRKETVFTTRPLPGAHKLELGFSINHLLKKELKMCKITKEAKFILNSKKCYVNNKPVLDVHYMVGLMDVVSFPELSKYYRVVLNENGFITAVEIDEKESNLLLCKLINKTKLKNNEIQLNTLNARNIKVKKDEYKTSGSLLIELPSQKILEYFPLEQGSTVMLIGGKNRGQIGVIDKVDDSKIYFKKDSKTYLTLKKFAFVLGKNKPRIKIR